MVHSGGRLGNNMCQYLSVFLLRHIFGIKVSIKSRMKAQLSVAFKSITLPVQDYECFSRRTQRVRYNTLYKMLYAAAANKLQTNIAQNLTMEPLLKKSYYVYNHPCPTNLIMADRDVVRRALTFRDDVLERARDNINRALKSLNASFTREKVTLITVHVRRGDYGKYLMKHFNMTQLDDSYFKNAFDYFRKRYVTS